MDEGIIRCTQKIAEMGENTTYRVLSAERTPLQIRTNCPTCERCLNEDETTAHVSFGCEAIGSQI
jgi:hypothetical protein